MIDRFGKLVRRAWRQAFLDQRGVFQITNKQFADPDSAWLPAYHNELADQTLGAGTLTTAVFPAAALQIATLKWVRLRVYLKSLGGVALVAGEQILVTVQGGTGTTVVSPENIAQKIIKMEAGDLALSGDIIGCSLNANGFQSYRVIMTALTAAGAVATTKTPVLDLMIDAA